MRLQEARSRTGATQRSGDPDDAEVRRARHGTAFEARLLFAERFGFLVSARNGRQSIAEGLGLLRASKGF